MHINNALREELADSVVVAKFANTTQHGAIKGKMQTHMIDYFNLEVIKSCGILCEEQTGRSVPPMGQQGVEGLSCQRLCCK